MESTAREGSPEYPELPNHVDVIDLDDSEVEDTQVLPQLQEYNSVSDVYRHMQNLIDQSALINRDRLQIVYDELNRVADNHQEIPGIENEAQEAGEIEQQQEVTDEVEEEEEEEEGENHGDDEESARKRPRLDDEKIEEKKSPTDEKEDESWCQICMEPWTSSGSHRLCCLSCGHLFGQECVVRWLKGCTAATRRCPSCNVKADLKDVRVLYANKLIAIDNTELNRLKIDNETLCSKNKILELQLSTSELRNRVFHEQVQGLMRKIGELEHQLKENSIMMKEKYHENVQQNSSYIKSRKFHMEKSLEIDSSNGCRVFDYNEATAYLAISQKTSTRFAMFAGYGVKVIDVNLMNPVTFIPVHQDAIRDLSFHSSHQSLVLSVSFDKTAKLVDVNTRSVVHNFPVGLKAWSCSWAGDNPNNFLVGCEQGKIVYFDIRQTSGAVDTLHNPGIWSPVVSLASVPPSSSPGILRGGFLACMLNSCYAYEPKNNIYVGKQMFIDGSYFCVRYDKKSAHGLISCRGKNSRGPTAANNQSRHSVFSIEKGINDSVSCHTVHTFEVGDKQTNITRPCFVDVNDDTLIAAHQESTKCIPLRSLSTGKLVYSIPATDPVVDICSFRANNNLCLATLSSSHLRLYHYSNI